MNAIKQGYKQTKVGIIPEDWEVVKIKEATSYVDYRGKTPTKTDNGVFLVTAKNIKQGFIDYQASLEFVSETEYHEIMRRGMPKIGDILITTEAPLGNVAQIDKENIALAQRVIKFRAKKNVKNDFLKHYFLSNRFQSYLYRMAIGTTVLGIQGKELHNMSISIPPLKEQEKIAEILTTWDEAISLHVKLIEEKEQLKIGLMQKLLSSEVRFAGFCDEWEEVRLGEIAEIYQPQTISQTELTNEGFDVYGANGIIGKYYQYNHELEQIAVTCRGNTCGTVNFTKPKSWITGNAMVINLDNSTKAIKTFIYYLFLNTNFTYLISGSGQPQITGNIKNHKLKLPLLPEQQKIAEVLSLADDELNLLKKELEELKQQKKGLMQKLLTGEVRVMA